MQRKVEVDLRLNEAVNRRSQDKNHTKRKGLVKVVVPIYEEVPSHQSAASFRQMVRILAPRYPILLLAPEGLDLFYYHSCYERCEVERVPREWLGRECGIEGYNRMMLSREFYERFREVEYILICQTDAWIFSDRLEEWCARGYDYVGAPWPKRPIYNRWPVRLWLALRKALCGHRHPLMRQDYFNRVGNGGLSLRRVEAFIEAAERHAEMIRLFKERRGTTYNEDWFWSLIPKEFTYPSFREALAFSFDTHPELCYELAGERLPFGCHGWSKPRNYPFWRGFIRT
uniref:DUF5672 family protein n=1 Tax=Alistipes sp. TaxID=1872444 RepID=UPI0040579906